MTTTFSITQQSPNREKTYLYPEGDLSGCTAWTAHGAIPNWACVDDDKSSPDYTTTYVSMATNIDTTDLYELPNAYINGTIDYVKIYNMVRTVVTPQSDLEYYITVSPDSVCTHAYYSNLKNLTTGWAKKSYLWNTNPATSSAWTTANIDSLSIGMKANSGTIKYHTLNATYNTSAAGDKLEHNVQGASTGWEAVETMNWFLSTIWTNSFNVKESLFNIPNHTTETGTINSVTVFAWVSAYAVGYSSTFAVGIKTGGTEYWDTRETQNLSWGLKSHTWDINPNTGSAWSWADIDNLQIGVQTDNGGWCTQVYAVINYNEPIATEIDVTQCYAEVAYTPSTTTCFLNMPTEVSSNHARNTKMFNFWNGEREVYDHSRSGKSIVLKGKEWGDCCTTTETFTFNTYDTNEVWQFNPERMVDGTPLNFATSWTADDTQLLTSSTASDVDYSSCGNITKVEIYFVGADAQMQPIFNTTEGSMYPNAYTWYDITNDSAAPNIWSWADVKNLDIRMYADFEAPFQAECGIVYVRVTYKHNAPCCRIKCVRNMGRNGASVTLDGFSFGLWAGTYKIKQFGWQKISNRPEVYDWILELEDES